MTHQISCGRCKNLDFKFELQYIFRRFYRTLRKLKLHTQTHQKGEKEEAEKRGKKCLDIKFSIAIHKINKPTYLPLPSQKVYDKMRDEFTFIHVL